MSEVAVIQNKLVTFNTVMNPKELEVRDTDDGPEVFVGNDYVSLHPSALKIVLVQPTTGATGQDKEKYKGKKGKLYFEEVDEVWDELKLLPVAVLYRHMTYYGKPFNPNEKTPPDCYSTNGLTPAKRVANPVCDRCYDMKIGADGTPDYKPVCPNAQWVDVGGSKKRLCQESTVVAFLDFENNATPVFMEFKGTAAGAFNAFKKSYGDLRKKARRTRSPISNYYIKLSVSDEGNYYKPTFEFVEDASLGLSSYTMLIDHYARTVFQAMVDSATADPDPVGEVTPELESAPLTSVEDLSNVEVTTADGETFSID